jgi:uncharacterized membrane protein
MMLKILQGATVAMFVVMLIIGMVVLFAAPERMPAYKDFVGSVWPIFVAEIVPAFLGRPLIEAVRNKKKEPEDKTVGFKEG